MQLPDVLRDQLKNPLGNLISDNDPNKENIIKKISAESVLITVGDRTTENMLQFGLRPQIQIIDGLEKRNQCVVPTDDTVNTNLSCRNPPGEITEESIQVIQKAFLVNHQLESWSMERKTFLSYLYVFMNLKILL